MQINYYAYALPVYIASMSLCSASANTSSDIIFLRNTIAYFSYYKLYSVLSTNTIAL